MPTVNGDQAIAWMRAKGTNLPGSCLNTCWQAYGSHPSVGAHAGQYPEAIDGWNYATKHHPGDMNPPAGYPVWFGPSPTRTDSDAGAGDVVISLGGGQVIATDANGIGGRIGVTSIAARAARIQRPYLGWTEDFLGYDVITSSAAIAATTATPITASPATSHTSTLLEDNMPYILSSDAGQTFISGDQAIGFSDPSEVQTTSGSGVPTVAVSKRMHNAILGQLSQKTGLPIVVGVQGGDGTIYTLADGHLVPMSSTQTISELLAKGAPQITITTAERDAYLKAS